VPAASSHRHLLLASSIAAFAAVFTAFLFLETPGFGIGHFFYLPIALAALAYGTRGGAVAGGSAAGLYSLGIALSPHFGVTHVTTVPTVIRFVTLTSLGLLIGAFASANQRLVDRLTAQAQQDPLTGLLNTRVFDEALERRCAAGGPFVLVLADMDNLKAVNDMHGHAEGNRMIRRVADVLDAGCRAGDELARVGGDEFALLTEAGAEEAKRMCARLQHRARRESLELSLGWAAYPTDGTDPVEIFRKADDRLYGSKLVGRHHPPGGGAGAATR
jgi:diguanylate cyclase (GGDEF)-like protein